MAAIENVSNGQFGLSNPSFGNRVRNLAANGPLLDAAKNDLASAHPIVGRVAVGVGTAAGRMAAGVSRAAAMNNDSGSANGGGDEAPPAAPAGGNPFDPHPGLSGLYAHMAAQAGGQHPLASIMRGETAQAPAPQPMPQRAAQAPSPFSASVNPRSPAGGLNVQTHGPTRDPLSASGGYGGVSDANRQQALGSVGTRKAGLGINAVPSSLGQSASQVAKNVAMTDQGGG